MTLFQKTSSFGGIFKRASTESEVAQFGRNPHTDWKILCIVFLILNLLAIGVSLFMYGKIDKGEIFLVDRKETVSIRTLNRFELEKTVSFFADKQERFNALKRRPLSTVDPFIPKSKPKK